MGQDVRFDEFEKSQNCRELSRQHFFIVYVFALHLLARATYSIKQHFLPESR